MARSIRPHKLAAVTALALFAAIAADAVPGDLDPTFGDGGLVIEAVSPCEEGNDRIHALAVDERRRTTAVGLACFAGFNRMAVARFLPGGGLDESFSGDGSRVLTTLSQQSEAWAVARGDGRILVAGSSYSGIDDGLDFTVVALKANGTTDQSFGDEGAAIIDFADNDDVAQAIAVQDDGKIVLAGAVRDDGEGGEEFGVARLNPGGSPDLNFGTGGRTVFPLSDVHDDPWDLLVQPNDRIVVAGTSSQGESTNADFALLRLRPDGSPDNTFSDDGKIITPVRDGSANDEGAGVVRQKSGRLIMGGSSMVTVDDIDFSLIAFESDGDLDTTWGNEGIRFTDFGDVRALAKGIVLQRNGKIVAAGDYDRSGFALARYGPNGAPDSTFSFDSKVLTEVESGADAFDVGIDSFGKLVVGGYTNGDGSDFLLARYKGDPVPSSLTVAADKSASKLVARGRLRPPHPGMKVKVELQVRSGGGFDTRATKRVAADGRYAASFTRQDARTCRLKATFAGDEDHLPSKALDRFAC